MSTEHSNAKKGFARETKQVTLGEAIRETTDTDAVEYPFEEYGPTAREPVPIEEENYVPGGGGVDYRELPGTGLGPWDFKLLSGEQPTNRDIRNDRHPDDKHDHHEHKAHKAHGEAMARAVVLEQADDGGDR